MRAVHCHGGHRAADVVAKGVVLGIFIPGKSENLFVGLNRVPGFHKGLGTHLPVAVHDPLYVHTFEIILQRKAREVIGHNVHVAFQGLAVVIEIDEDKTAPGAGLHFRQGHVPIRQMLKIPLAGDALEFAVQIPGGAVEGAAEFIHGA